MSLYDLENKIKTVTRVEHSKQYDPSYIVASFVKDGTTINLHYKNYTRKLLMDHMSRRYQSKYVDMNFWDPDFCGYKNLLPKDVTETGEFLGVPIDSRTLAGYISSLISLHKIIIKTFENRNYNLNVDIKNFDKNVMQRLFCSVDIVMSLNQTLISLIIKVFGSDMRDFLITPSGKFRFVCEDIQYLLVDTKHVHDVSTAIVKTNRSVEKILKCHLELLKVCDIIYSPQLITSYRAENVLLNILKLNIDLDKYERLLFRIIDYYVDKEGSLDIVFILNEDKHQGALSMLDMIKEYRLSSNSSSF